MFEYRAIVTKVYDGDTVTVDIDLGFGVWVKKQKLRLLGINAPEVRGASRPEGLKSRDALRAKILGKEIIIKTQKDKKGKYGRWLATIYDESNESINEWLLNENYAKRYGK
jgi:micrococcal nuclease